MKQSSRFAEALMTTDPRTPEQLAEALAAAASRGDGIRLGGRFTKDAMAGPLATAATVISTRGLNRVLQYDPRDLTISVEAGMPWTELTALLAEHHQMLPLDPPFAGDGTVGGTLSANLSGPRRRLYGTARDMVIGMKFATLEGKLVQSGGMVVKNVAGLDMAKMLIGSFGTLAAIAVANFKVFPKPPCTRTFTVSFASADDAFATRDRVLRSVLQPAAVDLVNPRAAGRLGLEGWTLLVQAAGTAAVIDRYAREIAPAQSVGGNDELTLWEAVREFVPRMLSEHADGACVRVSTTLAGLKPLLTAATGPALARAATGICYLFFEHPAEAVIWMKHAAAEGQKAVIEFAPVEIRETLDLWPCPGDDLAMMRKVKAMFDPGNLLNRGRLYGRI
jgi:glycolate oxidase FAD binding subunit